MGDTTLRLASPRGDAADNDSRLDPTTVAWLLALPMAVLGALAVAFLGPPLSDLLSPKPAFDFLRGDAQPIAPEPVESMRYALAVLAAALLSLATVVIVRWRRPASVRAAAALVAVTQGLTVGLLIACMVGQRAPRWGGAYFGVATLAVAAALTAAMIAALRSPALRRTTAAWLADSRRRRIGLLAIAAAVTAIWVLPGVNTDTSIAWGYGRLEGAFPFDETFAVLNGLTPWVDFNAQYAALLPFAIGAAMLALGKTALVFTIAMCTLTALALLAIYDVFRRVTGSALAALALYLAFVPMSLFANPPATVRFTPGTYFGMFPLRFVGPYALAWLLARRLERPGGRLWPLLLAGGLALLNNVNFGLVALVATVAALVWTGPRERLPRLAREAAIGLAGALLLYSLFALVRTGELPDPARGLEFIRLYGVAGYSVGPLPGVLGLPLVMLLTYAAALATGTARALAGAPNRVLTGMLVWSSIFGFGSATYYVARSGSAVLPMMFSAWTFALLLLTVERLARQPRARPGLASLAVLFGFALALCAVVQLPAPWSQVERMQAPTGPLEPLPSVWSSVPTEDAGVREFVASIGDGPDRFVVRPGAPIAVFTTTGHRTADACDAVDVVPYTGPESIHTVQQLEEAFDALRDAGGNTALVPPDRLPLLMDGLLRRGFALVTSAGPRRSWPESQPLPADALVVGGLTKWIDLRHPHAPWLRHA